MKLASFHADGADRVGLSADGIEIFDLASVVGAARAPRSMLELIEAGAAGLATIEDAKKAVAENPKGFRSFTADSVIWHPPVRNPSKICCLALNNSANADRIMRGPKTPAIFLKAANALVGHRQAIECKPNYGRVHPEPELAIVISKKAKNISPDQSFDHVFGYSILNDITAPNMREEDTFHYRAIHPKGGNANEIEYVDSWTSYSGRYKGSDTFAPMGPWIVTKDEIPDPHVLDISCHHKDRLVTADNTANLFHKTREVIAYISGFITLLPGDVVSMGTALAKSAAGGAVQNIDLNKMGGPISVTIQGIGTLSNPVAQV